MKTIRTVLSLLLIIISSFCLAQQKKATFTITDSFGIVKQFAVDDAFLILYKHSEDIVTDSIRFHYRKQGDKMVLEKKEVLK